MSAIFMILALAAYLGSALCSIIILVDAFQSEIWKGVVCLLCGLYGIYYALFEFERDNKWTIVLGSFFGSALGFVFLRMAR